MNQSPPNPGAIGRPREFDPDAALGRAMDVFWSKGYEGASLADLTEAMGISRPSLYAAFGNKETLFRRALDRYAEGPAGYFREALDAPTGRAAVERLLFGTAKMLGDRRHPGGCMIVQGALACGEAADPVRKALELIRTRGRTELRKRLERARREGELPPAADPDALAHFYIAVMHGMAVQAAGGLRRNDLMRIAKTALDAWPA